MNYLDLAPIKAVYELYKKIGEPHTARTFLRHSCSKKGESPLSCHLELRMQKAKPLFGVNLVPINEHITFVKGELLFFFSHDIKFKNWQRKLLISMRV